MKRYTLESTPAGAMLRAAMHVMAVTSRLLLVALVCTTAARAQSACDATYSFDGNLDDSSGNGYDGVAFGREGQPATPVFGEGISGQALLFDGATGISTPLDLHFDNCPQVTITGWLRLNTTDPGGTSYIVSAGEYGPHGASLFGRTMVLRGRGNGLQIRDAMRDDRAWFFFAGVYDFDAGTFRLRFRNRTVEGNLADKLREPEGETFFGVRDARLTAAAKDVYLDEVRIVSRALNEEEIGRIVAQAASRPWHTAVVLDAARSAQPASGPVNAGLTGPIESGGAGSGLIVQQSGPGPLNAEPASAEDYATANSEPHTLESMRESMAARDPLAGAGEAVAERGDANRPLDLESDGTGPEPESDEPQTTIPYPVGSKLYSGVSGTRGDILREIDLYRPTAGPFDAAWLTAISMVENSDRPCGVEVRGLRPVDDGNARLHEEWDETLGLTGCGASWFLLLRSNPLEVEMSQGRPAPQAGGDASAIGQLQVCHNDRNNRRVKGLRINGARINADGTQTVAGNADAAERTNCRAWATAVLCPADSMATGLVVHATEASGDNEQIVGLQLICREVSTRL